MSVPNHEPCDRREALRTTGRWLALSGVAALSGGLLLREPPVDDEGGCRLAAECRHCRAFSGCRLPRALVVKGQREKELKDCL